MKVGIAYTTYNRVALWRYGFLKLLKTTLENPKYKNIEFILSVSDDGSRPEELAELHKMVAEINERAISTSTCLATGTLANIARNRNRALAPIRDCDYIFSFEDDIYPYNEAWLQGYCECLNEFKHLMYLPKIMWGAEIEHKKVGRMDPVSFTPKYTIVKKAQCGGIMLAFTKDVIAKIGGFDSAFDIYGFEHAEMTERANICLDQPVGTYFTIKEAEDEHWFVSADEKNFTDFLWDCTPEQWAEMNKGSISQRITEAQKNQSIAKNMAVWMKGRQKSLAGDIFREIKW